MIALFESGKDSGRLELVLGVVHWKRGVWVLVKAFFGVGWCAVVSGRTGGYLVHTVCALWSIFAQHS